MIDLSVDEKLLVMNVLGEKAYNLHEDMKGKLETSHAKTIAKDKRENIVTIMEKLAGDIYV